MGHELAVIPSHKVYFIFFLTCLSVRCFITVLCYKFQLNFSVSVKLVKGSFNTLIFCKCTLNATYDIQIYDKLFTKYLTLDNESWNYRSNDRFERLRISFCH